MKRNKAILCAVASFGLITAANTINANAMTMRTTTSSVETVAITGLDVVKMIGKLPYDITLENKDEVKKQVQEARAAYNSLSDAEKANVGRYDLYDLKSAELAIEKLESVEAQKATARDLVQRIEDLKVAVGYDPNDKYNVSDDMAKKIKDNKTEIQNIRKVYDSLDYSIRYGKDRLVTNYNDFSIIECKLAQWM